MHALLASKKRLIYIAAALLVALALILGFVGGDSSDMTGKFRSRSRIRMAPPTPTVIQNIVDDHGSFMNPGYTTTDAFAGPNGSGYTTTDDFNEVGNSNFTNSFDEVGNANLGVPHF